MKPKTSLLATLSVLATTFSFTAQAAPQVYDLKADWSDTQNPNGTWEYRGGESLLLNTLVPWTSVNNPGPIAGWSLSTPLIAKSADFFMYQDGINYGVLEPGDVLVSGIGENVLWTAPANGTISVAGSVWPASVVGNVGTSWNLKCNGVLLSNGELLAPQPPPLFGLSLESGDYSNDSYVSYDRNSPYDFSSGSGGAAALLNIPVAVGDQVALQFNTFEIGLNYTITFTPDAVDPVTAIEDLALTVMSMNLQNGIENSFDSKLDAALNALDDVNTNNDGAACNALGAFINAVEAQRGNKLTESQADQLIAAAQEIQAALNCGN